MGTCMRNLTRFVWVWGCLAMILTAGQAYAVNCLWVNAGAGNWAEVNNWNATVPTVDDRAVMELGGTANISSGTAAVSNWLRNQSGTINLEGSYYVRGRDWVSFLGTGQINDVIPVGTVGTLNMYTGSSFTTGQAGYPGLVYSFNVGGLYHDSSNGGTGYFNQYGGTATFQYLTEGAAYHMGKGFVIGQSGDGEWLGVGGLGVYTISGGALSILDTAVWIGAPDRQGYADGGTGTLKVVGTGPSSISINGGNVHLGHGSQSKIVAAIDATGLTPIVVTNSASIDITAGSILQVDDLGAAAGTYTVMSWNPGVTTLTDGGLVLSAPAGWSMNVGAGELTVTLVPEPATISLIVMGGLALLRRRK